VITNRQGEIETFTERVNMYYKFTWLGDWEDCFNPLNAKLNAIYNLLALLGAHPILHISGVRVNKVTKKD
jgi:hypothetical protein